jgi:hypothetical protein
MGLWRGHDTLCRYYVPNPQYNKKAARAAVKVKQTPADMEMAKGSLDPADPKAKPPQPVSDLKCYASLESPRWMFLTPVRTASRSLSGMTYSKDLACDVF